MALLGFSINMVTLFGLFLAIGLVVDDAIVVVENVERNMAEFGMSPKEAAIKSMEEVSGAIIGITLVLMAVFVPPAFLGGITGQLFRQFSLTIAITMFFSAINALTLSPALCALIFDLAMDLRMFSSGFLTMLSTEPRSGMRGSYLWPYRRVGIMVILFVWSGSDYIYSIQECSHRIYPIGRRWLDTDQCSDAGRRDFGPNEKYCGTDWQNTR